MKKNGFIICLAVSLILSLQSFAQNRERNNGRNERDSFNREDFMAKRNSYLTEKMGLTADEAAVFIPLDNELMRKKFEVGRDCHRYKNELRKKEETTDEEYKKALKCSEEVKEKREQLDKEYLEKFKKVLSAEKILKYQDADKVFMEDFFRDRDRDRDKEKDRVRDKERG